MIPQFNSKDQEDEFVEGLLNDHDTEDDVVHELWCNELGIEGVLLAELMKNVANFSMFSRKVLLPGHIFRRSVLKYWSRGYARVLLNYIFSDIENGLPLLQNAQRSPASEQEPILVHTTCPAIPQNPPDHTTIRLFSNPTKETCFQRNACENGDNEVLSSNEGIWCHSYPLWIFEGMGTSGECRLDIKATESVIHAIYTIFERKFTTMTGDAQSYYTIRLKPNIKFLVVQRHFIRRLLLDAMRSDETFNDEIMILECRALQDGHV